MLRITPRQARHERIHTTRSHLKAHWLRAAPRRSIAWPGRKTRRLSKAAYPNRPVRFIVPLAAGGGLDFVARVVGEQISREFAQNVFVENRTGAGGTLGIDMAIKSPPDGYSVLVTNDNVAAAPHVLRLNVDFLKELMPVVLLGRQPQAFAVHPSLTGVNSIADLIALVKQKPGHRLCDLGCWLEPACADGVVRQASRHQARSRALSRRRPGDQ